jgi:hypothetical protein
MKRKIKQLERIERLRRQIHELSSWRLTMVTRERERLANDHAEMLEALGEGLMAYGAPSAAGTRRVRSIEQELAIANAIEKNLEKRALDDGRLAKLAEGSLEAARDTHRDKLERRSLEDLIESSIAADTASRKP